MHATKVLPKILSSVIARLDARNVRRLFFAVEALLAGWRLTLTALGRHFPGAERRAAPLKRFDRLLGNHAVQALRAAFYQAARLWLRRMPRPVLIVDWREVKSDGRWHLLRAAVVAKGRTLTVYEEVHPTRSRRSLGGHWVGRVRQRRRVMLLNSSRHDQDWIAAKTLYDRATARAAALGEVALTESKRCLCRLKS